MSIRKGTAEEYILEWRSLCLSSGGIDIADLQELEDYLRREINSLTALGLSEEEAFLIGVKRLEDLPSLSAAFQKTNSRGFWQRLLPEPAPAEVHQNQERDWVLPVCLAIFAGLLTQLPKLFGIGFREDSAFFLKNLSLFVLPFVAVFFATKRQISRRAAAFITMTFGLSILLMNRHPFAESSQTMLLSSIHLPLFLWLITGLAYTGSEWRSVSRRMDFLRFTGELFVYTTLFLCGVVVISGLTSLLFSAIGIDAAGHILQSFAVPTAVGAPIIAAYFADRRRHVVENFAPILARIFAPLLLCVLTVFLGVLVFQGTNLMMDRSLLIGLDLLLILVLGIVFYTLSTRKGTPRPQMYDWISLLLILTPLIIDGIALSAIISRLSSYGISPNKLAALGENILIFINLAGLALLFVRFFRGRIAFSDLERWQSWLLPLYALWLGLVGLGFPLIFSFQ
ncbi:MAG: hypothetical protein GX030_04765 [Firmicutes bacterium]|nr:hypothetical protein [Bacillota bacterium]